MKNDLDRTRVLITGAGVRIGRAIAFAFARAGAQVVIHYNQSKAEAIDLQKRLLEHSPGHELIQADLLDPKEREAMIPALIEGGKALNCLVNNASVYRRCLLTNVLADSLRSDYEINFVAPFMLMRDFALYCDEGSIINLLDQRVANVDPSAGTYGFAKKSLRDATEAAAVQWAPRIRVNAVAPGVVLPPPGVAPEKIERLVRFVPMARTSDPREIASACIFLTQAETITGQVIYVDGGLRLVGPQLGEPDDADYSS